MLVLRRPREDEEEEFIRNDFLRVGGHIGYVVVPEFRRQGHATAILCLALQFANDKLGLGRVLVTCDEDNIGSIKTIENNGGVSRTLSAGPIWTSQSGATGLIHVAALHEEPYRYHSSLA